MIPAYWERPSLCAGTARRDWDDIAVRLPTNVMLRDRDFPPVAPGELARGLGDFLRTPHGGQLPVYLVLTDGTLSYWTTHQPSAEEYVRQHPAASILYLGRKVDL
jgi:hypothetical protein